MCTSYEGWASRWASSPSLVSSSRPSVSWSRRPTWTRPGREVADHVADGRAVAVVAHRGDHAGRLVHRVGHPVVAQLDAGRRRRRCGRCAGGPACPAPARRAVHADPALVDHVLADPPGADAGAGEHLLQPLPLAVAAVGSGRRSAGWPGASSMSSDQPSPAAVVLSSFGVAAFIAVQSPTSRDRLRHAVAHRPTPQQSGCSSSTGAVSGSSGASSGRSARRVSPSRSRNSGVVP